MADVFNNSNNDSNNADDNDNMAIMNNCETRINSTLTIKQITKINTLICNKLLKY